MRQILSSSNRAVLEQFAFSNVLLGFDFDGTLAPIVELPDAARMSPETRTLLTDVARLYPSVVISGRAQADVLRRLRGVPVAEVIGNHGLEPWRYGEGLAHHVQEWSRRLGPVLTAFAGVELEDKVFSLAIHFRRSREKRKVRQALADLIPSLDNVRVVGGKQVINLIPEGAPHKGFALLAARQRLHCDTAIYVGDDETDEDVFNLDEPGRLLTIRVGSSSTSGAQFALSGQKQVNALLRFLCDVRHGRGSWHSAA